MKSRVSAFQGVHWDGARKCWRSQIRKIGFHRRYSTEMEAVAHYNALARLLWPRRVNKDTGSPAFGTSINSPWTGRPKNRLHYSREGWHILIDNVYSTSVDADDYTRFKDIPWFVRNETVWSVTGVRREPNGRVDFNYRRLEEWVWIYHTGEEFSEIRGRVFHKDGVFLNNKFSNLDLRPKSVSEEAAPAAPELLQENSQGCDEAEGG